MRKRINLFTIRMLVFGLLCPALLGALHDHPGEIKEPLTAKTIDIGVMLKWSTEHEADADFYVLEKSIDGHDFDILAEVTPTGGTEVGSDYSFIDLFPENEKIYYRLKAVYKDGKATAYQAVQPIKVPITNFVISKMNTSSPADNWSVNLEMFQNGSLMFELVSMDGLVIDKGHKRVNEGYNELNFSLSEWPDGIYTLTMEMSGDMKTLTIQKIGSSTLQVSSTRQ